MNYRKMLTYDPAMRFWFGRVCGQQVSLRRMPNGLWKADNADARTPYGQPLGFTGRTPEAVFHALVMATERITGKEAA